MSLNFPPLEQMAPDFTAPDQNGHNVTLSALKGKNVVLYFYPKAMTPGCTVQACGIRDIRDEYKSLNTIVLGISPDAPSRLQKFIEKYDLNFDLLSDEDHHIAEQYGVWGLKKFMGKEFMGIHRVTFIMDAEGKLRHIMDKVKTKSHHDDVIAILKTL